MIHKANATTPVFTVVLLSVCGAVLPLTVKGQDADLQHDRDSRAFLFDYGATVVQLPPGERVRVWLPVPPSNVHQRVEPLEQVLPFEGSVRREAKFGNQVLYFEGTVGPTGAFAFKTSYQIERDEIRGLGAELVNRSQLSAEQQSLFLAPSQLVPTAGKPIELIADLNLPNDTVEVGRLLYDRVDEWMTYDKSKPGYGNGDVLWACDSQTGNCTDFHSLFISLARSKNIPARFEIGFPLPAERGGGSIGGYHCWAMFFSANRGWIPVDISEADKDPSMKDYFFGNLTAGRVVFSVGRDIDLVPKQDGPPLNYFVYPYVEIAGQPLPKEQIQLKFAYEDLPSALTD